ncbi:MAG: Asp-tRNA(Asn)/Glu-tRNA(Gln) amidotransferase subunit GatC [Alphaproteobacteria bacterium]|nr:Asp-tRNA(Asn)/Glu-tRNA(Gln) amidotransferase subunit GatC [Alphaproteobacteria bacterium]
MAVDKETVKRIAFLSRLKIEDDKIEATQAEFNKILQWIEQLNEVTTEGVEPLVSVNDGNITCREDIVTTGNHSKEILANAPQAAYGYFTVPKVIE